MLKGGFYMQITWTRVGMPALFIWRSVWPIDINFDTNVCFYFLLFSLLPLYNSQSSPLIFILSDLVLIIFVVICFILNNP